MALSSQMPAARPGSGVVATVEYMRPMATKPARYLYEPPAGEPEMNWKPEPREVWIGDARELADRLSLQREGFILRRAPVPAIDFDDQEQVRSHYYPEIERLVLGVTGASSVLVFDHNVRSGSKEARKKRRAFPPARNVHADYTLKSGPQRAAELSGHGLTNGGTHIQFINVWRPLQHEVETDALAVLAAESVSQDDLVATDLKYVDRTGEFYSVKFNPEHRWYYVPRMKPEEILIFMNFDSRDPSRANCVPHVSFADPSAGTTSLPRESIEVRTIAFFD